jgi:hypothetical protein
MSISTGPWGQPTGEYLPTPRTPFDETVTIPLTDLVGFKLHISAHPDDADVLARVVLPTLRVLHVHHKVVRSEAAYVRLNVGSQRGKFITIYPGPARSAQRVLDTLDPTLVARGFRPGPVPTTRQSGHREHEIRVGDSGLVSCYWGPYTRDGEEAEAMARAGGQGV